MSQIVIFMIIVTKFIIKIRIFIIFVASLLFAIVIFMTAKMKYRSISLIYYNDTKITILKLKVPHDGCVPSLFWKIVIKN